MVPSYFKKINGLRWIHRVRLVLGVSLYSYVEITPVCHLSQIYTSNGNAGTELAGRGQARAHGRGRGVQWAGRGRVGGTEQAWGGRC